MAPWRMAGGSTATGCNATSGKARRSSANARGMWYPAVTTSMEFRWFSSAQVAVSAALPRVSVATRPSVTRVARAGPPRRGVRGWGIRRRDSRLKSVARGPPLGEEAQGGSRPGRHPRSAPRSRRPWTERRDRPRSGHEPDETCGPSERQRQRANGKPGGETPPPADHGSRLSQRRTVPCAVANPINPAASGSAGSPIESAGGRAVSHGSDPATPAAAKGAAKLANPSKTGSAASAPITAP